MNKIPTPEEMRNATLSPGTKEYLVAYRKAEEAQIIVSDRIAEARGEQYVDGEVSVLLEKLQDMQEEILRLMMNEIKENLSLLACTEI